MIQKPAVLIFMSKRVSNHKLIKKKERKKKGKVKGAKLAGRASNFVDEAKPQKNRSLILHHLFVVNVCVCTFC